MASATGLTGRPSRLIGFAPALTGEWVVLMTRSRRKRSARRGRRFAVIAALLTAGVLAGLAGTAWTAGRIDRASADREALLAPRAGCPRRDGGGRTGARPRLRHVSYDLKTPLATIKGRPNWTRRR
ncbi:MAG: hypothetical protein U0531_20620 [Dehalococcoidia bacterium]